MTETADYIQTVKAQQGAAAPDISAFVSANAGSGKTRVLTNRVARLLLRDTPPNKILCITFTKAAAAEMSDRLFKLLGDWALADDEMLNKNLNDLEGISMSRNAEDLAIARRLFARALETPYNQSSMSPEKPRQKIRPGKRRSTLFRNGLLPSGNAISFLMLVLENAPRLKNSVQSWVDGTH